MREPARQRTVSWPAILPFRGDLVAAGAVVLAVGVLVLELRVGWAGGVRAAITGGAAALLLALAWLAPVEEATPRTYVSALLLAAYPLAFGALDAIVDGRGWLAAGLLALAVLYAGAARARNSATCTLLAAASAVLAAWWAWAAAFDPGTQAPLRWIALVAVVALGLGVVRLRDRRRPHAVALANAAGLTALALGGAALAHAADVVVPPLELVSGGASHEPSWSAPDPLGAGWELFLLAVGFGLAAYGAADREHGPAWLGAAVLGAFVAVAAAGETSLLWWPVLLVVLGAAVVAAGLRPTTPLPPPPDADAPVADPRPLR